MDQLHKRFTVEQIKVLLQGYVQGTMSRTEVEEMLRISKTRFSLYSKTIASIQRRSPSPTSATRPAGCPLA